ncbi:hypothetical protein V8G54_026740 [Vigna mungo]|uniref:Uncharacterized protein n=1 Tax=Vigna mungo TaxID=3915 RepID=A0AAQ3N0W8_VIGMU
MKTTTFSQFLFLSLLAFCFASLHGSTTHPEEVQALKDIAKTLGKSDWDFNVDPCSENPKWNLAGPYDSKLVPRNNVSCNCSIDTFCHVITIDLSLNYLIGTVPKEWATLKFLNTIVLIGNRLSGPFPEVLTQIPTLKALILESNNFYGNLPPELGDLPHLERLLLGSNNFTGEWPQTLSNLTTLKDV